MDIAATSSSSETMKMDVYEGQIMFMQYFVLMVMGDGLVHYYINVFVLDYASSTYVHKNTLMMPHIFKV